MHVVERGRGAPLVFIPGLQGRWQYARPTVDALAERFRVLTFSLGAPPATAPFDHYAAQVGRLLDDKGIERAAICGLSFGGLVALRFAAWQPRRTGALILASTPGPGWHLRPRHEFYARLPYIFGPLFFLEAPFRARPEIQAALPSVARRLSFAWTMARIAATAPVSVGAMAARARAIGSYDSTADCARITARTLVLTGEAGLDYVVPVGATSKYVTLIRGAERAVLERTGHQGSLTRPDAFAGLVEAFVNRSNNAAA